MVPGGSERKTTIKELFTSSFDKHALLNDGVSVK
jgi:hypothetical protein